MRWNKQATGLFLFIIITLVLPIKLSAQFGEMGGVKGLASILPSEGYVVLNNGDTLRGKIVWSMKYVENNPVEIKFTPESGPAKTYNASEIRGFGNYIKSMYDDYAGPGQMENYISVPSIKKGVPVFMNRLLDGKITVFQNRSAVATSSSISFGHSKIVGVSFSFSTDGGLSIGPAYNTSYKVIQGRTRYSSFFISKNNGTLIKLEKKNYEDLFPTLFGDCPFVDQEIVKNPDMGKYGNFLILAEVYNQVCIELTGDY